MRDGTVELDSLSAKVASQRPSISAKRKIQQTFFFWKLWGSYAAIVLLGAVLIAFLVNRFFSNEAERTLRAKLATIAELAASMVASSPQDLWNDRLQTRLGEVCRGTGTTADIVMASGVSMLSAAEGWILPREPLSLTEFQDAHVKGSGEAEYATEGGEVYVYAVKPIIVQSERIGYVRIGSSTSEVLARSRALKEKVALGACAIAAFSLFLGFPLARGATRPLGAIESACGRIAEGDLSLRINLDRRDEFGLVARSVNRMADSIEEQMTQMRRQRQRLELLLRLLNDAVVAIDREGRIVFMNATAESSLSVGGGNMEGRLYHEALKVEAIVDWIERERRADHQNLGEVSWGGGDARRYVSIYIAPLVQDDHDLVGSLVVIRDVTESRRFEALRRDFSSNVSHELKTPVAAISALIDALEQGAAEDMVKRKDFLVRLRMQNERLLRLIEELLAISKYESTKVILDCVEIDLRDAVDSAQKTFEPMASVRGVDFKVNRDERPVLVCGDEGAVEVALNCLIENALKYTKEGGCIEASVYREGENGVISVLDTGVGIAPEHMDRIFERFYRVEASRSREKGGSGLGLAIVKHMAVAHGGDVFVESQLGKGSLFEVRIPLVMQ